MRITLLHNATAGSQYHPPAELVELARAAGHEVSYSSAVDEDLDRKLQDASDVVLVAGGDGTVADVARRLVGRDTALAVLPHGTANNIAAALGVTGTSDAIINGLATAPRRQLDVVTARGPWGSSRWLESAGNGLFGAMLRQAARERGDGTMDRPRALRLLQRELALLRPRQCAVAADGVDCSGSFLVLAAMNTPCIGARVCLAPQADPGDGWLDLAMVRAPLRRELDAWLTAMLEGTEYPEPPVELRRARRIRIEWDGATGHLDDQPWPTHDGNDRSWVELQIVDPPLTVLVGTAA